MLLPSSPPTRDGGHAAVRELLAHEDPPTAALCYNDVVAFGAMLGLQAGGRHLFVEAGRAEQIAFDRRLAHERAPTLGAREPVLSPQLIERTPNGDEAAAVASRQFALGGEPVARGPFPIVERSSKVLVDLMVQRHRARCYLETRHGRETWWRIWAPGLRNCDGCGGEIADNVISTSQRNPRRGACRLSRGRGRHGSEDRRGGRR